MKVCSKCNIEKPLIEYGLDKKAKDKKSSWCLVCYKNRAKQYRDIPGAQLKQKSFALKHKFNITLDTYNLMFTQQKGCCAICNTHQSELSRALAVDHNHETGKVRGLLCMGCNRGIGMLGDNLNTIQNAVKYLKQYN
jgi:hypothetical protein